MRITTYFQSILFILLFLFFSSCNTNSSQISLDLEKNSCDSAVSFIQISKDKSGKTWLEKSNTYYELVPFFEKGKEQTILLKIAKKEQGLVGDENAEKRFSISCKSLSKDFEVSNKLIETSGNEIDFSSKVIIVHQAPKPNDQEDYYSMYSILSGEKLMDYTYSDFKVMIPNTSQKRFFGYLANTDSSNQNTLGKVSFVNSEKMVQEVTIQLKTNIKIPKFTPEIQLVVIPDKGNNLTEDGKTVILTHLNENFEQKDIVGFALKMNYVPTGSETPISVLLPIIDDKIDLSKAQFDRTVFNIE